MLVVLSQVVLTVNYLQATLPGGAAWGSGSGGGLAARLAHRQVPVLPVLGGWGYWDQVTVTVGDHS